MKLNEITAVIMLFGLTALPAVGRTESDTVLQTNLGGQLLLSGADLCKRDADVVACVAPPVPMLGFQVGVDYRFVERWAMGLLGGAHWQFDSSKSVEGGETGTYIIDEDLFMLWRIAAEARYYPVLQDKLWLWVALETGLASVVDKHNTFEYGTPVETDVARDFGFDLGLGVGLDIKLIGGMFIGFEIRGLLLAFGNPAVVPGDSSVVPTEIGTAFWPLFGVLSFGWAWDI